MAAELKLPASDVKDCRFPPALTVPCQIHKNCRLLAGVSNLSDEEYTASRLPHGPRTGAPRAFNVGLEYLF
jgi:hypothetical protein